MASVVCCVLGGSPRRVEAGTVGEAKDELGLTNHTATVNGEPVDDGYELLDEEFVSFAPAVKGG